MKRLTERQSDAALSAADNSSTDSNSSPTPVSDKAADGRRSSMPCCASSFGEQPKDTDPNNRRAETNGDNPLRPYEEWYWLHLHAASVGLELPCRLFCDVAPFEGLEGSEEHTQNESDPYARKQRTSELRARLKVVAERYGESQGTGAYGYHDAIELLKRGVAKVRDSFCKVFVHKS